MEAMDEKRDILDQVDALMGRRIGLVTPMKQVLEDDFPVLTEIIGDEDETDLADMEIVEEVVVTAPPGLAEALGMTPATEARHIPSPPPAQMPQSPQPAQSPQALRTPPTTAAAMFAVQAPPGTASPVAEATTPVAPRAPEAPAPKAPAATLPSLTMAPGVSGAPATPQHGEAPPWETRLHRLLGEHEARMEALFRRIVREELERRGGA